MLSQCFWHRSSDMQVYGIDCMNEPALIDVAYTFQYRVWSH